MRLMQNREGALLAAGERLEEENKALRDRVRGTRTCTAPRKGERCAAG